MSFHLRSLVLAGALGIATPVCCAQLLSFPGAEGAGRFASGGRGGDIYYVTNLNDSGTGSLRHAISSAGGPRTVVFKVSGTIHLLSDLDIGKPNLTIAGQTAPGGGITIADRQTRVVNTSNVILQHLRFRVGDTHTRQVDNTYEPDALWVAGSNNVMVDHVSATWGVDEQLSVTHGSTNVTVQWSVIAEALHNAGHHKGNHGYGSIIHGGETSLIHNLYANSRSRNPAVGGPGGGHLSVVNNVISNPGDRFSYSGGGDDYSMNFVGNYGIAGPNTTRTNELFHADSATSRIYYAGNYLDQNKDGILNGTLAAPSTLTGTYEALTAPTPTAPMTQRDARSAYIQVLSRVGANYYRDPVDRRIIRGVINQSGDHIDSQTEVGGWPTVPSLPAPADSNSDGVPDYFAQSKGFSTSTNIRNQLAPNGYTWLENYLHSLTPNAYVTTTPQTLRTSSAFGRAADASVSENEGQSPVAGGNGSGDQLTARWTGSGSASNRNEYILLKFDLSPFKPGSITDARLDLTAFRDLAGTHDLKVYGLEHDSSGFDWNESTIRFNTTPGLIFDGDSATRALDTDKLLTLGTFSATGADAGDIVSFDNANLAVFLNLAAYFEGTDSAGLVTLLIERTNSSTTPSLFASAEAMALFSGFNPLGSSIPGAYAPQLVIQGTVIPEPAALGLSLLGGLLLRRRRV